MVSYSYNAWGEIESVSGTLADTIGQKNPLRYRGCYYDGETRFYYLRSRYYDPEVGRFINADSAIASVGGDIRGYNMFSYCFNNPINLNDSLGNWPKWIENIGSRLAHTLKIMGRIALSPLKAISAEIGAGVGIGAKISVTAKSVPIEAEAVAPITDSLHYEQGRFDVKNNTSASVGVNIANVLQLSRTNGREHSYSDENCTCDFLNSSFGEKSNCIANQETVLNEATVGISFGTYLLFGFEASISVDLARWNDELISIFYENLSYN